MWTVIAFISTNILSYWFGIITAYKAINDKKEDKAKEAEA